MSSLAAAITDGSIYAPSIADNLCSDIHFCGQDEYSPSLFPVIPSSIPSNSKTYIPLATKKVQSQNSKREGI